MATAANPRLASAPPIASTMRRSVMIAWPKMTTGSGFVGSTSSGGA
jgi:hypothetical protein